MGCPCGGTSPGVCSCPVPDGPAVTNGYPNYNSFTSQDTFTKTKRSSYSSGYGSPGNSSVGSNSGPYGRAPAPPAYGGSGRAAPPSYGNGSLVNTALSEKSQMQGLNSELAGFMQKLADLCAGGASAVDPAKYHEMMRQLERELAKLRNLYESELAKLRQQLQDANQRADTLANAANTNRGALGDLQSKLQSEAARARQAEDDLNRLNQILAGKDKQIADLQTTIKSLTIELDRLRPDAGRLARENDELRRQLELERKLRTEAEAKARALEEKLNFDGKAFGEQQKDLNDRIRVANDIIQTLENKLKQLANNTNSNLPSLLQRMRDGTVQEMRKFQQETEQALNNNLANLKKQMDEDAALRNQLGRDKNSAEDALRQCKAKCAALEGEIAGLRNANTALQQELERQKAQCAALTRDLENRLRDAQLDIMSKVKEYSTARDAQASLQNEINQYRGILDVGQDTLINCDPLKPKGGAPGPSAYTSQAAYSARAAPPEVPQPPREPPPSYSTVQSSHTRSYSNQYPVPRVTAAYNAPKGCPPGPDCSYMLPQISSQNRRVSWRC